MVNFILYSLNVAAMKDWLMRQIRKNETAYLAFHRVYERLATSALYHLFTPHSLEKRLSKIQHRLTSTDVTLDIKADSITISKGGISIICTPASAEGFIAVFNSSEDAAMLDYISRHIRKGMMLDVGANIGFFALTVAQRSPSAKIVCFEPVTGTYKGLCANIALNGLGRRIVPHKLALGDREGSAFITTNLEGTNHLVKNGKKTERITITTLDTFARKESLPHIALIKADIEGVELLFLHGAEKMIRKHRPVIILELQLKWTTRYGYRPEEVFAFLRRLGYGYRIVTPRGLRTGSHYRELKGDLAAGNNFIFEPEEK